MASERGNHDRLVQGCGSVLGTSGKADRVPEREPVNRRRGELGQVVGAFIRSTLLSFHTDGMTAAAKALVGTSGTPSGY